MEDMVIRGAVPTGLFGGAYSGRRVLVTGHTGFKGSWLCMWLAAMGAQVSGYALQPPTDPNLFDLAGVERLIDHHIGDVRDDASLETVLAAVEPEVVFHLAAQPLVRASYADPVTTYATNVMGTVNVLEAVRRTPSVRVVVNVTSDKCYENRERETPYRESDPMGGFDPYSSSKGCAELVMAAYAQSFFSTDSHVSLASARAGNVIGGGDWAVDRIVPDCVRALTAEQPIQVRNPDAVRPWQHVLEPLAGYLELAARLWQGDQILRGAWNFGPTSSQSLTVRDLVERFIAVWGDGSMATPPDAGPHEATTLCLDSSKARALLGWAPVWDLAETIARTADWYVAWHKEPGEAATTTIRDLRSYVEAAVRTGVPWAVRGDRYV
jgi:CDP-glucose 4,6-dehydratase